MEQKENSQLNTNIIKPKTDQLNYGLKVLSNGMKVLLISDPDTIQSSAALAVNIGSLMDPKDAQGLAHFCEHLLTMGSKKYPGENEYGQFLAKNGGKSNAFTADDKTVYFFTITNDGFEGALDRFAQMFISPTFNESSVEREIKAVDNEFSNRLNQDENRLAQIKSSEIKEGSPFNHFAAGNIKTLSLPDIRDKLLVYYKKYYSSDIMSLCIYNNKPLEEQLKTVENLFSLIPKIEGFKLPRYDEIKPYDETNLKYMYKVVPVKDANVIQLEWYFPFVEDYYCELGAYLGQALGHEGPNTLTSSLNKDNLCSSLMVLPQQVCKTYMTFLIFITLTKKGLDNYKEVILRTLKYIKILQGKEINKRFYNDFKNIMKINFDYSAKKSPIDATQLYSSNLLDFPSNKVLSPTSILEECNESIIKKYLDMITLENLNIYFFSKSFEKECNLTEPYYGAKYCKEKLSITEEDINSYKCEHNLDYPPANNFIPKNFDLLPPPEKISEYPEKIIDQKNIEAWYLQDTIFKQPKVCAVVQFITPKNLCDFSELKNALVAALLGKIVTTELNEYLYMAKASGVHVEFAFGPGKTHMIFQGFNDSMKKGVKEILTKIKNLEMNTPRCKETLALTQKEILLSTTNTLLNPSYKVNFTYLRALLREPFEEPTEIINYFHSGKTINIDDLIVFKNAIFKNAKVKWLVQGNVKKEEVLELVEESNKILEIDINKEKTGKFAVVRPVVITKNYNYIFRLKSPNPNEQSSSLISVYQTGLLKDIEKIYLKIIESFLKNKFYDQLRTKETLGYVVQMFCIEAEGYFGIANVVQSNSKTPEYCASRVRNFYKVAQELVKNISEEEFQSHLNVQIGEANKKDSNLPQVFMRNWAEISNNTYKFDRKEKLKENLTKCNREGFIKFFEKYFVNEVAILNSEVICNAHYEQNEKELKETKILEGENIKKRIICDSVEDYKACNTLGVIHHNPVFMSYNNQD